jgi:CheY-like chemotaxis protein
MRVRMIVGALCPLSILQIGSGKRLFHDADEGLLVAAEGALGDALDILGREEFDAIVLGRGLPDGWPPTAYERLAEMAGSTPIIAWTDSVEQLTRLKTQHGRMQDLIVAAAASSSVVEQLTLAATIRRRALAAEPGLQAG